MKAILEFNLDEPEDRMAHLRAVQSTELALVIWESFNGYRKLVKHSDVSDDYAKGVEDMLKMINESCEENGIIIDKLIE